MFSRCFGGDTDSPLIFILEASLGFSISFEETAMAKPVRKITEAEQSAAEKQIKAKQQEIKYDQRDFTIKHIGKVCFTFLIINETPFGP